MEKSNQQTWEIFRQVNTGRRAIRHFTGEKISDDDMLAILAEAQLAPSSNNLQLYEFHWIKDPGKCAAIAAACNQNAGTSAKTFVVITTGWRSMKENYARFLTHMESSDRYDERTKAYYYKKKKEIRLFRMIMPSPVIGVLKAVFSLFTSHFTVGPFGRSGIRQWAARNSVWAAQTLLLAASAKGIDSCPMEGFNPFKVAKAVSLKRGEVISIVIALGRRSAGARVDPQWRLPLEKVLTIH